MAERARGRIALAACALLVAIASCGESSSPDATPHATVTFQRSPMSGQLVPDSATITVVSPEIDVAGLMMTGDPCRVIKGDLIVSTGHIQLTMHTDTDGSQGCVAVVARFGYAAKITGVSAGTWVVNVRHLSYGTGAPDVIATQSVVIH